MTPLTVKAEDLKVEVDTIPPKRRWPCYKCQREASQFTTCSFCPKICCDRHRRYTQCCHLWKCEERSCYCKGPPVCEQSTDEHQGDSSAESSPSYSDALIQHSKEHRGSPHDIAQTWVGGVGAAMPGEAASHFKIRRFECPCSEKCFENPRLFAGFAVSI